MEAALPVSAKAESAAKSASSQSSSSSPQNPSGTSPPQAASDDGGLSAQQCKWVRGASTRSRSDVTAIDRRHLPFAESSKEAREDAAQRPPPTEASVPSDGLHHRLVLRACEEGVRDSTTCRSAAAAGGGGRAETSTTSTLPRRESVLREVLTEGSPPRESGNAPCCHPPLQNSEEAEAPPAAAGGSSLSRGLFRDRTPPAFLALNSSCSTATGNTDGGVCEASEGRPGSGAKTTAGYTPKNPYALSRFTRALLEFTELPLIILWIYLVYFLVIVSLTAHKVKSRVWLSALVAGFLVGLGLNANAYHAIMYRGTPDFGMVVRFFLIPFGVAALSGLTHSLRDQFLLVFPRDPSALAVALSAPALAVVVIASVRILVLVKHRIPLTARNLLLNGRIYS